MEDPAQGETLYSIFIINKAGGLIFHRDFLNRKVRLSSNNYLQIGMQYVTILKFH
jgi:hypothetical protein